MTDSTDQLCIDTIRTLSMDAVQKANSGHPGMPMAMAPAAYLLYAKIMRHDPADPDWPDRDRFVLSAGHGSMLLYSVLHLSGYDLSLDDIKDFRQWDSRTPGHPERERMHHTGEGEWRTPGVEVTTGPLGQGFANGVGMAVAEAFLRDHYGPELVDHHIYAICSDGDLMEGIASEAASLAGKLKLGKLVYLYDDNSISLDGPTSLSFDSEDVTKRFEAYGWDVRSVHDANDITLLEAEIEAARSVTDKPSLIRVKSIIGYPSPNKQNTASAHGSALGEDEVRLTKEALGWDPDAHFLVPDGVYEAFSAKERGGKLNAEWHERFDAFRDGDAKKAEEWDLSWQGRALPGVADALANVPWDKPALASRKAGQAAMAAFSDFVPTMLGGSADLSGSTNADFPGADGDDQYHDADRPGRALYYGVREHGMGGVVNGMAAHGGIVRPFGATFLQFSDYMRGSIRLGAVQNLLTVWVFTHDSVGLGEDGPTHQPIEHLAALRAIPNLIVLRPGDNEETAQAWRVILEELDHPAALILSRQGLEPLDGPHDVSRGAYVVSDPGDAKAVVVGTGSEVQVAVAAAEALTGEGIPTRVVSMPSWELYEMQDDAYKESVLPAGLPKVSVEAAASFGWEKWVDATVAIDRFGASAPGPEVMEKLGITPDAVAEKVKSLL